MATNLKPFCSKRLMISPISPLCTPSGLMAMNVRSSSFSDIELKMKTNTSKTYTKKNSRNDRSAFKLTPSHIWHAGVQVRRGLWLKKPLTPSLITCQVTVRSFLHCLNLYWRLSVDWQLKPWIVIWSDSCPHASGHSMLTNHVFILTNF